MITKTTLIAELGSAAAVAEAAGCTRQAVSQWPERVPVRSAIALSRSGRWSLNDLRPDVFGDPAPQPDPTDRHNTLQPVFTQAPQSSP